MNFQKACPRLLQTINFPVITTNPTSFSSSRHTLAVNVFSQVRPIALTQARNIYAGRPSETRRSTAQGAPSMFDHFVKTSRQNQSHPLKETDPLPLSLKPGRCSKHSQHTLLAYTPRHLICRERFSPEVNDTPCNEHVLHSL